MGKYDDIVNIPHHRSVLRPHMSMHDRAAQFAPFAAKGYDDAVIETARLTDSKIVLDDDEIAQLDLRLKYILDNINNGISATITYFVPDDKKSGGAYLDKHGIICKIDLIERKIVFDDYDEVLIDDIVMVNIDEVEVESYY